MMTLEDAVELVLFAFQNADYGDIFVQKSPATTIGQLASALIKFLNKADTKIVNIGERHGEKLHESLLSGEEIARTSDLGKFFKVSPDTRDLNYTAQEKPRGSGLPSGVTREGYSSHTTQQLSESEILSLLDRIVF
jgi:UDP-glucose 4-epimerase